MDPVVINLDCPIRKEDLSFLTKDANGLVKLSSPLANECALCADSMGYASKTGSLSLFSGATDAASAARAGIPATTLMAIPLSGGGSDIIHTENDTVENLDRVTVEEVISICIKVVENRTKDENRIEKEEKPLALESEKKFTL